jgi:hypothetical protein
MKDATTAIAPWRKTVNLVMSIFLILPDDAPRVKRRTRQTSNQGTNLREWLKQIGIPAPP